MLGFSDFIDMDVFGLDTMALKKQKSSNNTNATILYDTIYYYLIQIYFVINILSVN